MDSMENWTFPRGHPFLEASRKTGRKDASRKDARAALDTRLAAKKAEMARRHQAKLAAESTAAAAAAAAEALRINDEEAERTHVELEQDAAAQTEEAYAEYRCGSNPLSKWHVMRDVLDLGTAAPVMADAAMSTMERR